jgi:hypothetical protein
VKYTTDTAEAEAADSDMLCGITEIIALAIVLED